MGQRIVGIDLGAYSVKIAELDVGFRSTKVLGLRTFRVPEGGSDLLASSLAALPENVGLGAHDLAVVALGGDRALLRVFDVPFSDQRKIQAVIGTELADDMPWEFEDVVYDFVAMPATGKVLVGAARNEEIGVLLQGLSDHGVVPKQVCVAPLVYGGLVRRSFTEETVLVLDMGHARTNICVVVKGKVVFGRTVSRGGAQVTEALRQAFFLNYEEAERLKHDRGFVATDVSALDAGGQRIAEVVGRSLTPVIREIRRTLQVAEERMGTKIDRVLLTGGTALLGGIDSYLAGELERPTQLCDFARDDDFWIGGELASEGLDRGMEAVGAQAIALGLELGQGESVDLRRGDYAFKTDKSFFREKIFALAIASVLLLIFGAINAYAGLSAAEREGEVLEKALRVATRKLLGRPTSDPESVSRTLRRGIRQKGNGIPRLTAVDVLRMVSEYVPGKDAVKLDISRIDIKATKTYLRGTADSLSSVGEVVKGLKAVKCFKDVTSGKISGVADGKKEFSVTINTTCF